MRNTLKDLREGAGLSLREAAERLHAIEPSAPQTHVGLKHIENRGTRNYAIIKALANLYGVDMDTVASAAGNSGTKSVILA